MSSLRQVSGQAGQYLLGRVGLVLLGLLSFPLLTRLLSVEQYGQLSLLLKLALLWTVLSKAGLQNAVLRFLPPAALEGPEQKRAALSTILALALLVAAAMVLLALALVYAGVLPLGGTARPLVFLGLGLVFIRTLQPVLSATLRAEQRTVLFNVCEISGKALAVALSLLALTLLAVDLRYYLAALLLAEGSVVVGLALWLGGRGAFSWRSVQPRLAWQALAFGAPLIAYELASVVLDSGDRILIGHYAGLQQLGYYSAAYAVATYAEEAVMQPVNLALFPACVSLWAREGQASVALLLSRSLDLFFAAACGVFLLVLLSAHDLLLLLASRKFLQAQTLIPVLVAGLLVYALHIFFNTPLLLHRKSAVLSFATVACCGLNIGLNILLLPRMGILGSALATLFSYLALTLTLAFISRRYLPFALPLRGGAISLAALCAVFVLLRPLQVPAGAFANLLLRGLGGLLAYAALLAFAHPGIRGLLVQALRRRGSAAPLSGSEDAA